jgi:peptidoglycan/xylan/chitin deacetylase (PgdA/CDA1 family)
VALEALVQLKDTLLWLMYRSGAVSLFRQASTRVDRIAKRTGLLPLPERGAMIFMLHQITERSTPFRRGIDVELFDAFCAHLAEHYQVLPLDELERQRRSGRVPSNGIALTFDDGHADNYHLALPILRRYNLPATVFVTTGFINNRYVPWATRLALVLERAPRPDGPIQLDGLTLDLSTIERRLTVQAQLGQHFQNMEKVRTHALIDELADRVGVDVRDAAYRELCSWEQLAEMNNAGFRPGAHTVSHPFLTRIPIDQARREMAESKEEIEGRLKTKVDSFAYPNGKEHDYNAEVMDAARQVGFSLAVTALHGVNDASRNPFDLRRVGLYGQLADAVARIERWFYATA